MSRLGASIAVFLFASSRSLCGCAHEPVHYALEVSQGWTVVAENFFVRSTVAV